MKLVEEQTIKVNLSREDGHGLRRALDIEVEGQRGC